MDTIRRGNENGTKADFGLVGLAVMGENLVLNIESRGFTVAVFNRTTEKVDKLFKAVVQERNSSARIHQELVAE